MNDFTLSRTARLRAVAAAAIAAVVVPTFYSACSSGSASNAGGDGDDASASSSGASSSGASSGGGSSGGSSGGGSSGGSSSSSSGGGDAAGTCGDACGAPPSLVDPGRVTEWNPGILADVPTGQPLGTDGLPQRTTTCATVQPGGNIQAAIDACPAGQVVQLAAGKFTVSATVNLKSGVVLRGAGSGTTGGTIIVRTGGGSVLSIGTAQDQTCSGGTAIPLTKDGAKESTTVTVGSAASKFKVGQLALVDLVDDPTVQEGDCQFFKRVDKRSVTQRVEIVGVDTSGGTLTLGSPLHWDFKSASPSLAMITPVAAATTEWAGIEHLFIQGGTNPGYDGQMAGGIDISNAAYSWVKDVQTDGSIGGMHVTLTGTYRVVVRDSYFHNSANYGFAEDCYGIVLRCGSAESLVENNIARFMNKPILFNVSGGGNVVGYNYADNSWATPPAWQETNIDCHCAFPHMELMEGNYAPHMGASNTHGNAGYLTYFRNYASSQFAPPDPVFGSTAAQTGNVTTLEFDSPDIGMNAIGNVLGTAGVSGAYDTYDTNGKSIFELGVGGSGASDISVTSLFRHGNFDAVSNSVKWDPQTADHTLPASFYLRGKPAWWPASSPWPWAGPDLTPMTGTLPAKDRSDHIQ